jgi:hypothetical protein
MERKSRGAAVERLKGADSEHSVRERMQIRLHPEVQR